MKKVKIRPRSNYKLMGLWVVVFAIAGAGALLWARAAEPIRVDNSLPQVRNVRVYGDDRVITVAWDAPNNASSAGIVGYFVEYGETTSGAFPYTKQTTDTTTQLQPVSNGKEYTIRVYSAHGSQVMVSTPGAHDDGSAPEMRGSGRVSSPVTVKATPSSARVDQLRQRMTGFFDDFNTGQGAFDELKWNQAGAACTAIGSAGAFINNQYHSHNQVSTISTDGEYCDRGQFATRARGIFDIAGRTDASPGEIVFDIDGATHARDVWYLDLIPTTARVNGAPVDITAHASIFDDEASDPMGIRIVQELDGIRVNYFGSDKNPHEINPTFKCYEDWAGLGDCDATVKTAGMSPLPELVSSARCRFSDYCLSPVPNVRRHWQVRMTTSKITIFIDSVKAWEGPVPAEFRNITKYQIHSTLFGYNTGKDDNTNPKTFLFHWDNFGFNGPQSPTVVHNYIEGGPTGNTPYLGRGTLANRVPKGPRTTIIKIPDQIGSPVKSRIMFTLSACGPGWYTHSSSRSVIINGHNYPFAHPSTQVPAPVWSAWSSNNTDIGNGNNPMSMSLDINPSHLITGSNQVQLNLDGHHLCVLNVHIELEYNRGTQPSYTQPRAIFGEAVMNAAITPVMESHDKYLFVEQNLELTSAENHGNPDPEPETCPAGTTGTPPNCVTPDPEPEPDPEDPTFKAGDINRDGNVSFADLALLLSNYGRDNLTGSQVDSDITSDGRVNFADLALLLANYGR